MPYRFDAGEEVSAGLRRCLREQLEYAIHELETEIKADPAIAVHEARKSLKKERSLLRLGRGTLEPQERRRENMAFRQVARRLAGIRDADAMIHALDQLAERYAGQAPEATFAAVREHLEAQQKRDRLRLRRSKLIREVLEDLRLAQMRIDDWRPRREGWAAISDGLSRSYGRGRKAFGRARAKPTTQNLHEWRKRSKDVYYNLRVLRPSSPNAIRGHAKDAHQLTEMLGDLRDLSLLRQQMVARASELPVDLDPVIGLIDYRVGQLQAESTFVGERLYAERPKAFVRRLHRYWDTWQDESDADSSRPREVAEATRQVSLA